MSAAPYSSPGESNQPQSGVPPEGNPSTSLPEPKLRSTDKLVWTTLAILGVVILVIGMTVAT